MFVAIALADRYFINYWNPVMTTAKCNNCKKVGESTVATAEYKDLKGKLFITKATKTISYPPTADEGEELLDKKMKIEVSQKITFSAFMSAMFSAAVSSNFAQAPMKRQNLMAACKEMADTPDYPTPVATNAVTGTQTFAIPVYKNNFRFLIQKPNKAQVAITEKACGKENIVQCTTIAPNNPTAAGTAAQLMTAKWKDCVAPTYRKYWRTQKGLGDTFTGYKRGERIQAMLTFGKQLAVIKAGLALMTGKKDLTYDGLLKFDSVKQRDNFKKFLDQFDDSTGVVAINALVFMDLDIGQDAWPIVVACILGAIALFLVLTMKCVPKWGLKMFGSCCADLFEGVTLEKAAAKVSTPKPEEEAKTVAMRDTVEAQ